MIERLHQARRDTLLSRLTIVSILILGMTMLISCSSSPTQPDNVSETPNSSSTINSKSADQGEAATDSSLIHAESGKSRDLSQQSGPTEKLSSSSKSKRTKSERDEQLAEELAAEQLALKLAREKADNRKKADKKKRRKAELAEARRLEQELEAARRLEEEIAAAEMAMRVESAPSSTLTEASTTQSSEPPLKQTPTQTPTQTPEQNTATAVKDRDWSEVKYPWEIDATKAESDSSVVSGKGTKDESGSDAQAPSLVDAPEQQMAAPEIEVGDASPPEADEKVSGDAELATGKHRGSGADMVSSQPAQAVVTSSRDWSEVKYPWEEGGKSDTPAAKGKKKRKEQRAESTSDETVADETSSQQGITSSRDWSEVKYPWEEGGSATAIAAESHEKQPLETEQARIKADAAAAPKRRVSLPPPPPGTVTSESIAVGNTTIEMVRLPGGQFQMGSNNGDLDERPVHQVSIARFSIGRFEVTQQQWKSVMGENPSFFNDCPDCPVDSVSWNDINRFLDKLNRKSGKRFRLPSEAEWEYACLAGDDQRFCGAGDDRRLAWTSRNSDARSQPVGQLKANRFGIHDMSGNVYEWVADCWHNGYSGAPRSGTAWQDRECERRVLRGGAWYYEPRYAVATYRNANIPHGHFIIYGFRLAHD